MKHNHINQLWGAAFNHTVSNMLAAFTGGGDMVARPPADLSLLPYDLWVNTAHVVMLEKTGIITRADAGKILSGLSSIDQRIAKGSFGLSPIHEDVHTAIESYLTAALGGEIAGKLHTARSRNDQVVTDTRLFMRDAVLENAAGLISLIKTLLRLGEQTKSVPLPGFTHHQHAMVSTVGHMMAAFSGMLLRDVERFRSWYALHNVSPLGSVASYGTSFPIDRTLTAKLLGFSGPGENSLDPITNRWEPEADLVYSMSVCMNHLSTIAETFILFTTPEFGIVTLSDAVSFGSSIMPQKKNPSSLEVIKGKTSALHGQLMTLLSLGKAAFIGYNNDSQWSKYALLMSVAEFSPVSQALSETLEAASIHRSASEAWCKKGFIGATTLMEQIAVTYNLPMRTAKILIEKSVKYSGHDTVSLDALEKAMKEEGIGLPITKEQVEQWQNPEAIIAYTTSYGGPGKHSMKASLKSMKKKLEHHTVWLHQKQIERTRAKKLLNTYAESIMKGGD